jgi:hypothetical protein
VKGLCLALARINSPVLGPGCVIWAVMRLDANASVVCIVREDMQGRVSGGL